MKRILLPFFILLANHAFASEWSFIPDSGYRHSISISSNYFFESNSITNQFASYYLLGKFIDDEIKAGVSDNLSSDNRMGTGFNSEISFGLHNRKIFGLGNSSLLFSVSNHYHINSTFKRDAFEIFFRGNKSFAGKTADLGNFEYNQVLFQQFNLTFGHTFKREENSFEYNAGLSLNKGQKLYNISSSKATLFTETNGEYLLLDADLKIHQSDSSNNSFYSWNGTGASGNFSFSWDDKSKNTLKITADNFGFVYWNDQTAHIDADTSFRFDGIDVSELFVFSDSINETVSIDSSLVEPYLTNRESKSYLSPLPSLLSLSYRYVLAPGKLDLNAEVSYLFFAGALPKESLTFGYNIHRNHRVMLKATYGGYTGFQAGLAYKAWLLDGLMFTIQSDYLGNYLDPANSFAQGAFVSLTAYF